jgi:hypothetical protein
MRLWLAVLKTLKYHSPSLAVAGKVHERKIVSIGAGK